MSKLQGHPVLIIFFCLSTLTAVNSFYLCGSGETKFRSETPCESKFVGVGILPDPLRLVPALRACWKPIKDTPGCAFSIISSSIDNNVTGLDRKCCGALLNLNHDCFKRLFLPSAPELIIRAFTREFGEKTVEYCASKRNKGNKADAPVISGVA